MQETVHIVGGGLAGTEAALGHDFDGQAALEVARLLEGVRLHLLAFR
jgi:folate-dependent tRNA-U54 methylase TrmFO/GidA